MAGSLKVNVGNERHGDEVMPPELDGDDERYNSRHLDKASRLELGADNEKCKKVISDSCSDIQFDNHAKGRRHKDNPHHYDDVHLNDTQESSRQGSHDQYYVDFDDNVAALRKLNETAGPYDSELGNDSFERRRRNSTVRTNARKERVERTPLDNYTAERLVSNSAENDNGGSGRRLFNIDVSSDSFERSPVVSTADCFERDNEADARSSSDRSKHRDVNLKNVETTERRHTDGTNSPDDFEVHNDVGENDAYSTQPDISALQREQPGSHIYYEVDLDAGAIFKWRSSDRSSRSTGERQKLRDLSSSGADHGIKHDCMICLENRTAVSRRECCKFPVCHTCLETYYATKVSVASVQVQCIGSGCNKYVSQVEIMSYLTAELKDRYMRLLVDANHDPRRKTCPRCSHITELDAEMLRQEGNHKYGLRCLCSVCDLIWCFKCQAPWHEPLSCRRFQHEDRQFKAWAKQQLEGQANAQKCPKCKVYIQRNGGCDHMTCSRCLTDFCYQCGEKYRKMKFIGDHRSKYSILGCKYRYKPNSPVKRRFIRGSIFGGKLLAVPIIGGLALGAGAVVAGLGLAALPFYGGYRLHKLMKQKKKDDERKAMERIWRDFMNAELDDDRSTTFSYYDHFEFDEFGHVLANYYGDDDDDDDEYNMEIYSLATSSSEELEESAVHGNNLSPMQQRGSGEADSFDAEATDFDDMGAFNSDHLNLPADPKVLDGYQDEAKAAAVARTGVVRIPRRFCRTYFVESTGLEMKKNAGSNEIGQQKHLSGSEDVDKAKDHEVVETCDQVTHL